MWNTEKGITMPKYSDDIRFGQALGVDTTLLLEVESSKDSLHDIIYCSWETIRNGECPRCSYIFGILDETGQPTIDGISDLCDVHTQVFPTRPMHYMNESQWKLRQLALKRLV